MAMQKKDVKKKGTKRKVLTEKLLVGWCEWCQLSKLGIPAIKAKIDTGAKTSAIHAFNIKPFKKMNVHYVRFSIHPIQGNDKLVIKSEAKVIDVRKIMSSNGHKEERYIIRTPLTIDDKTWNIEVSLSDRDPLKFRMLLGREALKDYVLIDPHRKLYQGDIKKKDLYSLYRKTYRLHK